VKLALTAMLALCIAAPATASAADGGKHLEYLDAGQFDPSLLLPPPPAKGTPAEAFELQTLHRLIDSASKERLQQAREDADNETPAIFNGAVGVDLRTLPATWALLELVQEEGDVAAGYSKVYFHRMRPYSADLSLPFCEGKADPAKPAYRSYPSGHATLGYSVGWVLARLMPAKADKILARAQDYAMSRQICGAHYPADTDASHVVGTLVGSRLLADPRLAAKIAAARNELSKI